VGKICERGIESEGVMDGESDEPTDGEDKASQR